MLTYLRKHSKYITGICIFLLLSFQPAFAGGATAASAFSNPLAITLMILMLLLLIVIGILANILVGAAGARLKKKKQETGKAASFLRMLLLALFVPAGSLLAQDAVPQTVPIAKTIGGLSSSTFYLMAIVVFAELAVIIAMLFNIRLLIKAGKGKPIHVSDALAEARRTRQNWWDRMNKLRPVNQEAELDLGHEYDGIRELNNRLPPWWIYGFYLTIVFAAVYLWRFHVTHQGPSSKQEYEQSVARAELKTKEYLKTKGDVVDENTVTLLTAAADLAEGKAVYMKSCASCHLENGAGSVGPNLTDDYWLHGNDIKSVFKTIRYGINAMPQWQNSYSNKQMAQVASYIKSLRGSNPPNAKAPQGTEMKEESPAKNSADTVKNKNEKVVPNSQKNK